jgi:cytochrome c peroxidase
MIVILFIPAPLYCDLKQHDSGVYDPYDADANWNTPSLLETWRTGPYGHLGSFKKVREMIEHPRGHAGSGSTVSASEMEDLVAYVQSL